MTQFPPHWDDEKKKQYVDFMEKAQLDKGMAKVVVQLKPLGAVVKPPQEKPKRVVVATGPMNATEFSLLQRGLELRRVPHLEKTIAAMRTLGVTFNYDRFRKRLHVGGHALQQRFGESIENAILVLRTTVMQRFGFDPKDAAKVAVQRLCIENSFDPVLDYLDSLKWDGKPRLDSWLTTYLGAEANPLNCAMGRKVLIAAVRRVRMPGTKFDQIVVLEGPQGSGKSSAVKILAGDFFSDAEIIGKYGREVQELCSGV